MSRPEESPALVAAGDRTGAEGKLSDLAAAISRLRNGEIIPQEEYDELLSGMITLCRERGIPWGPISRALGVDERTAKRGAKKLERDVKGKTAATGG